MKKIILSTIALIAALTISAQTIEVYEYDSNGNLCSTPAYTSTNKVKVVFEETSTEPKAGDKVEGTTTINGTTYTKAVGGTVADYVDLGMVVDGKKILWATHNLGASKPEDSGAYIAWGENATEEEGYVNGIKQKDGNPYYDRSNLKYYNGIDDSYTKYVATSDYSTVDNITTLESEDDAATVNWGSVWHTPTVAEFTELCTSCTWTWYANGNIDYNGMAGCKVTGPNGNYIFLPLTGYRYDSSLYNSSVDGLYWSSSPIVANVTSAYSIGFGSKGVGSFIHGPRWNGLCIRPVRYE